MKNSILKITFFLFLASSLSAQDSSNVIQYRDVIISAIKAGNKDPFTQTTINADVIEKKNTGKDIPFILESQPAIVTTSDAGAGVGYSGMRIRGSDQTRINVTINGVPVNDAESQQVYFVNMPDLASSASAIQVQRGVGTSTNGAASFGASVNIQTNEIAKRSFGILQTTIGSFNTRKHTLKAGSGLIKNRFFIEGQLSKINSDGFIQRASSDLWSYHLKAGLVFKNTRLQFIHFGGYEKTYQAWYGVPKDSLQTNRRFNIAGTDFFQRNPAWHNQIDNYQQHYNQLFLTHYFNPYLTVDLVLFTTLGKGYYEEFKVDQRLSRYSTGDTPSQRGDIVRRRWLDNIFYGGVWGVGYAKRNIDLKFGGMLARYTGDHFGRLVSCSSCSSFDKDKNYYFSRGNKNDFSFYSKINYSLSKKVYVYADLQYRYVSFDTKGNNNDLLDFDIKNQWHFFNPKVGLKAFINDRNSIYASFALANREPARDEMIDNNNAIKPERMYNAELGYGFSSKRVRLNTNAYLMYYTNQLILTGKLNDVGNPVKVNTPNSFRSGLEIMLEWDAWVSKKGDRKLLAFSANGAYSFNKILNYTERVPTYDADYNLLADQYLETRYIMTNIAFSPSWVGGISASSELYKNLSLSVFIKSVSRQFLDNTSNKERSINPYIFGDIRLAYLLPLPKLKSITFSLDVFNFWNTNFENNGYSFRERYDDGAGGFTAPIDYIYYYPQAGTHFSGGITINF
jgi:iron complex outermembrane receptor protein